jgi:hypothetical protein
MSSIISEQLISEHASRDSCWIVVHGARAVDLSLAVKNYLA